MVNFLRIYKDQLGLLLLWLVLILVINPSGDFPLNDDWCYGKSVKTLYDNGYLKLYNWGEMTLVSHVYWGFFFTKIFGFSFTILRWSTLVMGFGAIIGIYELCKLANIKRTIALFATCLCIVNPIFLSLSFSFMTDVPFYCLTIWAIYFFIKALQTDTWKPLLIALVFCIWALLIRQLALVLPITWLIAMLLIKKQNVNTWLKALIPCVVLLLFYFVFSYVMTSQGLMQERYNSKFNLLIETLKNFDLGLLKTVCSYAIVCLTYIGFLLSPIHLLYSLNSKFKSRNTLIFIYTITFTGLLIIFGKAIPSLDNVLIDFGVGPTTLYDHYGDFISSPSPKAPQLFWWLITAIGVYSSIAFFIRLSSLFKNVAMKKPISPSIVFSLVFIVIYITPFLIVGVYDRYLLPLFPVIVVFLIANYKIDVTRFIKYTAITFLLLMTWFSVCATHDYLSWNRVRWQALNKLTEADGVPTYKIQGGVEFVMWHHFSEVEKEWWKNVKPIYTLVLKTKPNDKIINTYTYSRWLPGDGIIYVTYDETLDKELQ